MVAYVIETCRHESSITYYHFKTHGSSHTIATIYHLYIHPIIPPCPSPTLISQTTTTRGAGLTRLKNRAVKPTLIPQLS